MKARWIVLLLALLGVALNLLLVRSSVMGARTKAAESFQTPAGDRDERNEPTLDDLFAEVAGRVPAFGGMFIGPDKRLHVYLLDAQQGAAAEAALIAVFGRERLGQGGIQVLQGRYGFLQLKDWHDRHRAVTLAIPGVVMTGIAESNNRLKIGVEHSALFNRVEQELINLGVPLEAVKLVETKPVKFLQTLQNTTRPLLGGLRITNSGGGECTLGFLAVRQGQAGFVTNSHCTNTTGGVEGTVFHQAIISGVTNRVGVETVDPQFFTGWPCVNSLYGKKCRRSDSAFVRRDGGTSQSTPLASAELGYIASPQPNSLTVLGKYKIVAEVPVPIEGEYLNKVGKTTGLTGGEVCDTCVDINVKDTDITLICQDRVEGFAKPGDSGSPVFTWNSASLPPGADPPAKLYGILWGGDEEGEIFAFSAMGNIQGNGELGKLKTFLAEAGANSPPEVKISKPANGAKVGVGGLNMVKFEADIVDYEGCCTAVTWTSDKDGTIGQGTSFEYVFGSPGTRTITVSATDSDGATSEDSITLSTSNDAPSVSIKKPTPLQILYKGFSYVFEGDSIDYNEPFNQLPCNSLKWTSKKSGAWFATSLGSGCTLPVTFPSTGTYTVTLTGTDSEGATDQASVTVLVIDAPANSPPVVTILNPNNNGWLDGYTWVTLKGKVDDPDNKSPISYQWVLKDGAKETVLGAGTINDGQQTSLQWKPSNNMLSNCGGREVRIYLRATDADGSKGSDFVDVYVYFPVC